MLQTQYNKPFDTQPAQQRFSGPLVANASQWLKLIILMLMLVLNAACGRLQLEPQPNDPEFAPVEQTQLMAPRQTNGAIFQTPQSNGYSKVSFFEDRTARNVGDILTVLLIENTTAKKETETEVKKESETKVPEPTLFQRVTDFGFQSSVDNELAFKGEADSDQKNSLNGSISVTVTEVLASGTLRIRGEKWIRLNRGDEYIRISGLVRPDDIAADNSVMSVKIADARIAYSQTGELAHANTMGWLTRFFNSPLWPL